MCTICTNQEVKVDFNLLLALARRGFATSCCEPSLVVPKIGAGELVVEKEFDVWLCLEFVEEQLVKAPSVGSEVCLSHQQLLR